MSWEGPSRIIRPTGTVCAEHAPNGNAKPSHSQVASIGAQRVNCTFDSSHENISLAEGDDGVTRVTHDVRSTIGPVCPPMGKL